MLVTGAYFLFLSERPFGVQLVPKGGKELIKLSMHRVLNSSQASSPSAASQIHDLVRNPLSLGWLDANIFNNLSSVLAVGMFIYSSSFGNEVNTKVFSFFFFSLCRQCDVSDIFR